MSLVSHSGILADTSASALKDTDSNMDTSLAAASPSSHLMHRLLRAKQNTKRSRQFVVRSQWQHCRHSGRTLGEMRRHWQLRDVCDSPLERNSGVRVIRCISQEALIGTVDAVVAETLASVAEQT